MLRRKRKVWAIQYKDKDEKIHTYIFPRTNYKEAIIKVKELIDAGFTGIKLNLIKIKK